MLVCGPLGGLGYHGTVPGFGVGDWVSGWRGGGRGGGWVCGRRFERAFCIVKVSVRWGFLGLMVLRGFFFG